MVDVGLRLGAQPGETQRFDRVLAIGRGLESDVSLDMQGETPLVKMYFDGLLPFSRAVHQGDRDGALQALDIVLNAANDPRVLGTVRAACPMITDFLQILNSDAARQKAAVLQCPAAAQ